MHDPRDEQSTSLDESRHGLLQTIRGAGHEWTAVAGDVLDEFNGSYSYLERTPQLRAQEPM